MNVPYVVRGARSADFADFQQLRAGAGAGFTSLMLDDAKLQDLLARAEQSFAAHIDRPGPERYLLALEHRESGRVVGCCQVKATIGALPPFFNFRVLRVAQSSAAAHRRFDMDVLILVNEFTGCTEVGSLFVRSEHRHPGLGRALAQARYMLMASAPQRFNDRVVSELRGMVSPEGVSPFWEALGAHFFKMSFAEADRLSAVTDNQFILDLMPKYPIYADLLPEAARAAIGACNSQGVAARRMLEAEGFRFDNVVDIFDGGPLLSVSRGAIRTTREARLLRAEAVENDKGRRGLIASPSVAEFRCAPARVEVAHDAVRADAEALAAIGVEAGAQVWVWISDEA